MNLINSPEWQALQKQRASLQAISAEGNTLFSLTVDELMKIDCFYPHITENTKQTLIKLAKNASLKTNVEHLFRGDVVNTSEKLPALHTKVRTSSALSASKTTETMRLFSDKIRQRQWLGYTGKPISDILHIGIGGSDLGQRLTCHALEAYANTDIRLHFVANIDPNEIELTLKKINPETTLIILASKSFSTLETQMNMDYAINWMENSKAIHQQVIAVTAYPERILSRYANVNPENILSIPLGIGGRYSIWSAMGLVLCIWIGFEHFKEFLRGAEILDEHFHYSSFEKNIPVLMGLIGIWNINFFDCQTHAIIPYSEPLSYFPAYLQQLDMESNGKSHTIEGEKITYATGPVIWGGVGSNSQHSFHQLLHQGTHVLPVDFIKIESFTKKEMHPFHHCLNINCDSQVHLLARNPGCFVNHITLNGLTPKTLGALMALYEHKIFTQSQIWQINPFDQPGVEEAKILAQKMLREQTKDS